MTTATLPIFNFRNLAIGVAMLVSAGLALVLTPKQMAEADRPKIDLEAMIPQAFGDWQVDGSITPVQVAPDVQAKLDSIYNQTLSRTYTNSRGERVMLSVAYGGNQSDNMQVHRPEVCYPAQGFEIRKKYDDDLLINGSKVPVKRLLAAQGTRIEPITYWIVEGNKATRGSTDRKLARVLAGLSGVVADGMLVRISNIDRDMKHSFSMHDDFVKELLQGLDQSARQRLVGDM